MIPISINYPTIPVYSPEVVKEPDFVHLNLQTKLSEFSKYFQAINQKTKFYQKFINQDIEKVLEKMSCLKVIF
jgi:hypothetical protein